jgi:glucosamine-6-phosphate deaminase
MRLIILDDNHKVADWAANYIKKRINQFKPDSNKYFVLGLPTGSTPLNTYKRLIEFYKKGELSFRYVKTFNMDEYVGNVNF